jgi:hypothetical protein
MPQSRAVTTVDALLSRETAAADRDIGSLYSGRRLSHTSLLTVFAEIHMKAYRLLTFVAALVITGLLVFAVSARTIITPTDSQVSAAAFGTPQAAPSSHS